MKINELITEASLGGFVKGGWSAAKALTKGAAKGLTDLAAPGAWDQSKSNIGKINKAAQSSQGVPYKGRYYKYDATKKQWYDSKTNQPAQDSLQHMLNIYAGLDSGKGSAPINTPSKWDPRKKILSISDAAGVSQYKKTPKGWVDIATAELIEPQYAQELETEFNKLTGAAPVNNTAAVKGKKSNTIKPAAVVKTSHGDALLNPNDNRWYVNNIQLTNTTDIQKLNQEAMDTGQLAGYEQQQAQKTRSTPAKPRASGQQTRAANKLAAGIQQTKGAYGPRPFGESKSK